MTFPGRHRSSDGPHLGVSARGFRLLTALVLVAFVVIGDTSARADLYVSSTGSDAGACTAITPCASFARAYQVASPGDFVDVSGGTYGGQSLNSLPAKSAVVTFRPLAGAAVVLGGLDVQNTNNVEVQDMQTRGWSIEGADNVTYRGIRSLNVTDPNSGASGGYIGSASNVRILGGEIAYIDPGDGLHMNEHLDKGGHQNTNILIDGLFMHNLSRHTSSSFHTDCLQTGSAVNLVIRNSRFDQCGTQGLFLDAYDKGQCNNLVIENNWLGSADDGYNSLIVGHCSNVTVRYNSFTQPPRVDESSDPIPNQTSLGNISFVGNVIVGLSGDSCKSLAQDSRVTEFSYNVSDDAGGGGSHPSCPGATHHKIDRGLADEFVVGNDSDPLAWDLHLKAGASAIDAGDPGDYPATDWDGGPRPTGSAPDAGADEFGSGPGTLVHGAGGTSGGGGAHQRRLLGNPKAEKHIDGHGHGRAQAFTAAASRTGRVRLLHIYVDRSSTASSIVAGIYTDRDGHPGTLLAHGTLLVPSAGHWNLLALRHSASVKAKRRYWIAVLAPNGRLRFRDRRSGGGSETSRSRTLSALPKHWSRGRHHREGYLSAWGA